MTPSPVGSSMSASCSDSGPLSSTIWIARMNGTLRAIVTGMSATAVNERLAALTAAGTSIWLDQLSRGLIETGELARMVEQDSLQGVTSNPAIFEKSILGSADYDEDLKRLADEGKSAARSTARWRCTTCAPPPTCCAPSSTARTVMTATCPGRSRRGSRTTPRGRSSRPACTGTWSTART